MKLERVVSVNADITDVANWFLLKEDMSHKKYKSFVIMLKHGVKHY